MPGVRGLKVLTTQLGHRQRAAVHLSCLCGIETTRYVGERLSRELPGLVGRQHAIAVAKREATAAAIGVAVLNEKRLRAARLHTNAEAEKLVIPNDGFTAIPGRKLVYVALVEFRHDREGRQGVG